MTTPPIAGLVDRVKSILLSPGTEWPVIAAESTTARALYIGYVAPLAAIGAIALFVGQVLIGISVPILGTVRIGVGAGLTGAIVMYAMAFVAVFVLSWIVDMLASSFNGQRDPLRALKLVVYSYTPAWLAGIVHLVPVLGILLLLASLYSVYLLYVGLPVMMRCPQEKAVVYTVVIVVCAIIPFALVAVLVSCAGSAGAGAFGG